MSDSQRKPPGPGPSCGGSKRARLMLAAANSGPARKTPRREQPGPVVVFSRQKPKQEATAADNYDALGMQSTPKKQCTTPLQSPAIRMGASLQVPAAPRPIPSAAALPLAVRALRHTTCTQLSGSLASREQRQQLREQHLDAEGRQQGRVLYSSRGGSTGLSRLPAGMLNLGNTCYLNAVLQVLLSLPTFTADLKRGWRTLKAARQPVSAGGVYAALLDCVTAKESLPWGRSYITPASLKRALDASSAAFQGTFQQDAHELFCGLLDLLQSEVLSREAVRLGRTAIRISETTDPAARNFSFAVQHELACSKCGHTSRVVEEYMHLSLELPEAQAGGSVPQSSVNALLKEYFKEEVVEKSCEGCGGANLAHSLRHTIRRLPRVLVLHMKRFKVTWNAEQQQAVCQKLHTAIDIAETVRVGSFLADGALPPLAGGEQQAVQGLEGGKENKQLDANAAGPGRAGTGAGGGAQQGQDAEGGKAGGRPGRELQPRLGVRFYGSGAGGGGGNGSGSGTPVASATHALLSPLGAGDDGSVQRTGDFLRRRSGTPAAGYGGPRAAADEEAELQQALALSLLEHQPHHDHHHHHQQLHQQLHQPDEQDQPQQQWFPTGQAVAAAAGMAGALALRQRSADGGEYPLPVALIRAGGHGSLSAAAAEVAPLPPELETAAKAGCSSGSHGGAGSAGAGLADQWLMGSGHADGDRRYSSGFGGNEGGGGTTGGATGASLRKSAAEREEVELQRAIELSMLDQQGQQQGQGQQAQQPTHGGFSPCPAAAPAGVGDSAPAATPLPLGASGLAALEAVGAVRAGCGVPSSAADEDAELQRALQLSILEQQGASSAAAQAEAGPAADWQQQQQQGPQQQQQQGCADEHAAADQAAAGSVGGGGGNGGDGCSSPDAAAGQEGAAASGSAAAQPQAPAYVHAQIVEDDALSEAETGPETGSPAAAAAAAGGAMVGAVASAGQAGAPGAPTAVPAGGCGTKRVLGQYRLHAVANHQGPAASSGHFTADICDPGSRVWHRLNDSVASRISALEARSSTKQRECYLLFYVL